MTFLLPENCRHCFASTSASLPHSKTFKPSYLQCSSSTSARSLVEIRGTIAGTGALAAVEGISHAEVHASRGRESEETAPAFLVQGLWSTILHLEAYDPVDAELPWREDHHLRRERNPLLLLISKRSRPFSEVKEHETAYYYHENRPRCAGTTSRPPRSPHSHSPRDSWSRPWPGRRRTHAAARSCWL